MNKAVDLFKQFVGPALLVAQYDKDHGGDGHVVNPEIYTDVNQVPAQLIQPDNAYLVVNGKVTKLKNRNEAEKFVDENLLILAGGAFIILYLMFK